MKKITVTCLCFILFLLCIQANTIAAVSSNTTTSEQPHPPAESTDAATLRENAYRSGRGTVSGGARGGITRSPAATPGTGYTTGPRNPSNRVTNPSTNPSYGNRGGGFGLGGLFGGFAAGTLLGSLLNPFGFGGYGYGGGFSIVGLLFWGVMLYFLFRLFRRIKGQRR
ncbi:hypothetical protein RAC89_05150 [Paenibacillus sp. GD4]|uniref:hypothetical protein n=1 Tax=Paenibacillus sp. GD4 TaxID=3068890 RepID=UPI002796ADA6|nr:hypothetical protein [Paenibacillus sp. GD4]MDQ1909893.1 hypothetical protein [Paenibacillus sp. GD4]